jgi:hypothetical protein
MRALLALAVVLAAACRPLPARTPPETMPPEVADRQDPGVDTSRNPTLTRSVSRRSELMDRACGGCWSPGGHARDPHASLGSVLLALAGGAVLYRPRRPK